MKMTFNLGFSSKQRFFDRAIADAIEPSFKEYLSASGAYIRKVAQRSLRRAGKKKKPSPPGQPPRHHFPSSNEALRRIFFVVSADGMSVDIGPVRYNRLRRAPAPRVNEYGESVRYTENNFTPARESVRVAIFVDPKSEEIKRVLKYMANRRKKSGVRVFAMNRMFEDKDFTLTTETITAKYPARPFMGPALESTKTQAKLKEIWARSINRALKRGIRSVK